MRPPSAAKSRAMSAPMPRLAPVTTTALPSSLPMLLLAMSAVSTTEDTPGPAIGAADAPRRRGCPARSLVKESEAFISHEAALNGHTRMGVAEGGIELVRLDADRAPGEHWPGVAAPPRPDVALVAAVHDAGDLGPHAHGQTHRTRRVGRVEHGSGAEVAVALPQRGLAQAVELGMAGGIAIGDDLVAGGGDDPAVPHQDGAEGVVPPLARDLGHADRFLHPSLVGVTGRKGDWLRIHRSSLPRSTAVRETRFYDV